MKVRIKDQMADERQERLAELAEELRNLTESPLYEYRSGNNYEMVFGEGNPNAQILFIGEAPGENEAKAGRPFVGAAGKVLDNLLETIGLKREDVYITNIVKDRPPENRDPTAAEIDLYGPFLMRQIEIIRPKVIGTLGRFAMDFILKALKMPEQGQKIGELHGKLLNGETSFGSVNVVPLYHPAASFYSKEARGALVEDFTTLKQFVV
jgi:DNA polymerase